MKFFCILLIPFCALAERPNHLVCERYGDVNFRPDFKLGKRIDAYEERGFKAKTKINFEKKIVKYTLEGVDYEEALNQAAPNIYVVNGYEEDLGEYYGVFTFNENYRKASYSSYGGFTEFFICKNFKEPVI